MNKIFATFLLAFALFFAGCQKNNPPSVIRGITVDFSIEITNGNFTYLPLNLMGPAYHHVGEILVVLNEFEQKHSNLEIKSWSLEGNQASYAYAAHVFGIWIYHCPKTSNN